MFSPIVTLVGAILAMVAVSLLPRKNAVKEGHDDRYSSWGRGALYFLVIVLLAIVVYVLVDISSGSKQLTFAAGNVLLFLVMGLGLVADDILIMRQMRKAHDSKAAEEVHEVEDIQAEGTKAPEVAKPAGPAPKPAAKKVKKAAVKKVAPAKPSEAPKPAAVESAELIEPSAGPKVCLSCDTPIEHSHDSNCPVCGAPIPK
jgi:hypothetical protein